MSTTTTATSKTPTLPNEFSLKIGPVKEVEGTSSKKSSLVHEDLQLLASKLGGGAWSVTLKQLKSKLPSGAQFCNEDGEEVSESMTLQTFVKNSPKNLQDLSASGDGIKSVKVWYIVSSSSQSSSNPPTPLQEVMPEKPTPRYGSSEPFQKPTLLSSAEKGKLNQQSLQDLLQQVGADLSSMSSELPKHGLQNLKPSDWLVIQQKLGYLYGYYPDAEGKRFLKSSLPAFRVYRKLDHVAQQKSPSSEESQTEEEHTEAGERNSDGAEGPTEFVDGCLIERKIPRHHAKSGGNVEVSYFNSTKEKQHAVNGFSHRNSQIALGIVTPKAQLGASLSHETHSEEESKEDIITAESRIVASWTNPVVEIVLDANATEIHPECKKRIDALLKEGTYDMARKFLKDFGTTFSTRIACGGKLHTEVIRKAESTETLSSQKSRVMSAANASVSAGPPGGAVAGKAAGGHSSESGSASASSGGSLTESANLSWTAIGGDAVFAQSPINWLPSVANFNRWEIIEHIEVTPIIYAFDDFLGYEKFSATMCGLLGLGEKLLISRVPWLPSMFNSFRGFKEETGPIGYSFSTGASASIKPMAPPFQVEDKDIVKNNAKEKATHSWTLVKDSDDVKNLVDFYLPWQDQTQGAMPLPELLHHVSVSERSFTIVLSHFGEEIIAKISPTLLKWTPRALQLAKDISAEKAAFNAEYGDKFVTGWSTQRSMFAVFNVRFRRIIDFKTAIDKATAETLAKKNIADGCGWVKLLISRAGVSCDAVVLTSNYASGGHNSTEYNSMHPDEVDSIRSDISNIRNAEASPIGLATRSFVELLPHLHFPEWNNFSPDKTEELTQDRIKLIKSYVETSAKTRTPLLRGDAPRTKELLTYVRFIAGLFRAAEKSMSGFGYSADQAASLRNSIEVASLDIKCQLAACQWVQKSVLKEIELWSKDLPWHQYFKKHSVDFSWAPAEADRQKWGDKVVDRINQLVQRPSDKTIDYEWKFWSAPDAGSLIKVDAPSGCRLVGWHMISHNGSISGGGTWHPYCFKQHWDGMTTYWQKEEDLFVWRNEPQIFHQRDALKSHHWALKTWWLSENDFPFDAEILFDFEQDGVNHKKGSMAF